MNKVYFYKQISDYDNEAAHIYEHIFISNFHKLLKKNGFTFGLYGWVQGSTFNDIILIEVAFYDKSAEKLFLDFVNHPMIITEKDIQHAISVISVETRANIEVDMAALNKELEIISNLPFHDLESQPILSRFMHKKNSSKSEIINMHTKKSTFEKANLIFAYIEKDLQEIAIIFRIWPILYDNILSIINKNCGYCVNSHSPAFNKRSGYLLMGIEVGLRKGTSAKQHLENDINKMLKSINFQKRKPELKQYITTFKNNIDFAHIPEQIFDNTGVLVSRSKIAELFTAENVQRVWDKLEFNITNRTGNNVVGRPPKNHSTSTTNSSDHRAPQPE